MTFSTKQNTQQTSGQSGDQLDYSEWNKVEYEAVGGKEHPYKNGEGAVVPNKFYRKKKAVGILKFIGDMGLQPQEDASYEWKKQAGKGDELSEAEKEHLASYPDNYFKDVNGKRMQFKPERPTQEYALSFDFPKITIDYGKHPNEEAQKLGVKPLRVSYNGYFKSKNYEGVAKNLRFNPNWKTNKLSPNNPLYKLATAMGVAEEWEADDYDLGVLADKACYFDVIVVKTVNEGKTYYNTEIRNYSEIVEIEVGDGVHTVEQQIPACDTPFTGVLLQGGEYTDEAIAMAISSNNRGYRVSVKNATSFQPNAVKAPDFWLGTNYAESDLGKAIEAFTAKSSGKPAKKEESKKEPAKKSTPAKKQESKPAAKSAPQEPSIDFDDDIPF